MREKHSEFRDVSRDFADRPSVAKDSIHEIARSHTKTNTQLKTGPYRVSVAVPTVPSDFSSASVSA
jgi:hypothetical protein